MNGWKYVQDNFGGLICSWAKKYARKYTRDGEYYDFQIDLCMAMVEAYDTYVDNKPEVELRKILKTIPVYFFQNHYHRMKRFFKRGCSYVDIDKTIISIDDVEQLDKLYDKFFVKFVDEAYGLFDEASLEYAIMMAILKPDTSVQSFMACQRQPYSRASLIEFFKGRATTRQVNTAFEVMREKVEAENILV